MNNYAEFFPILKYQNGKLTRVNGSKKVIGGDYTLFPLFSLRPKIALRLDCRININGISLSNSINSLEIEDRLIESIPDPCFLVKVRDYDGYTEEEMEDLNKIWNKLMFTL